VFYSRWSLEFFIDLIFPDTLWHWETQHLREMSSRNISWAEGGQRRPELSPDNRNMLRRLSGNMEVSNIWIHQSLPRPVQGLIFLYYKIFKIFIPLNYGHKLKFCNVVLRTNNVWVWEENQIYVYNFLHFLPIIFGALYCSGCQYVSHSVVIVVFNHRR
jgi:hypothetical protein